MILNTPETSDVLPRVSPRELDRARPAPIDESTLRAAEEIVRQVREDGEAGLRACSERFGDRAPTDPLVLDRTDLDRALGRVDRDVRDVLERAADRIGAFATAQRECLVPLDTAVPGGRAGHTLEPLARAGCYAPGGRYPLPSSVLMTAVTARIAGVNEIWVASPRPAPVTLAAAAVAGADALLCSGGAHAVAALAHGAGPVPPCDVVVGPGNRWVTAAKQLVAGSTAIDMLAGPSELLILADESADPDLVAADLLAQAEHDDDAVPILVSPDAGLLDAVDAAVARALADLPTAATARRALANGAAIQVASIEEAIAVADACAPEHLQVMTRDPDAVAARIRHAGAVFIGSGTAEVFGDYGAGPNHVLPTGGSARRTAGLSVLTFVRVRTWLRVDAPEAIADDVAALARLEGLEGHARASEARRRVTSAP